MKLFRINVSDDPLCDECDGHNHYFVIAEDEQGACNFLMKQKSNLMIEYLYECTPPDLDKIETPQLWGESWFIGIKRLDILRRL